jgi:hypothetical protein
MRRLVVTGALVVALAGCATPGGPKVPAASVYAGAGFYDPWAWGPVYREPLVVVGPPARPGLPIAPAPTAARPRPVQR